MGPAKYKKYNHLKKSSEIIAVLRKGNKKSSNWLCLFMLRRSNGRLCSALGDKPASRCAVIVSKKIFHNATDRNEFKRVAREFFRLHKNRFDSYYDIVIKPFDKPRKKEKQFYREELSKLYKKGQLL